MGDIFKSNIKQLKLNKGGFVKTLNSDMKIQIRQAARQWLRAVIENVPVYSGMSRGSLLPLGGYLHVAIPIVPAANALTRKWGAQEHGISAGEAQGGYTFLDNNFKYTFFFATDVLQFIINDINVGIGSPPLLNPTPWNATEAGGQAFQTYLDENLTKQITKISSWVYQETIG